MRPSLIVFIDCFPYQSLGNDFLAMLPGRSQIRPGFGYSVNIVAELFAGKSPDALGYFNIFAYNPDNQWLRRWAPALRLLSPLRRWYLADRVVHRLLARRAGYVGNIPLEYIGLFERSGVYPFSSDFGHPTLFDNPEFVGTRVFHSDLRGVRPPDRDRVLIKRARDAVRAGESIFLSLSDLDALAHAHGVGSPEFAARVGELNDWLGGLIERFLAANPDGYIAVVSDHGASNPSAKVDLEIEARFGKASPDRYVYFLDATLGRFWVPDPALREDIRSYLGGHAYGRLITEEERTEYGIRSRSFGDLVWVVNEGYGISPNFLGSGLSRALHGYHPALPSQQAIFVASEPLQQEVYRAGEAYLQMRERMKVAEPTEHGIEG